MLELKIQSALSLSAFPLCWQGFNSLREYHILHDRDVISAALAGLTADIEALQSSACHGIIPAPGCTSLAVALGFKTTVSGQIMQRENREVKLKLSTSQVGQNMSIQSF